MSKRLHKSRIKQKELRNKGFAPIPMLSELKRYWVSQSGIIYDWEKDRFITAKRYISNAGKRYTIGKLVLAAFTKWEYSKYAHLGYKDGNKRNSALENVYLIKSEEYTPIKIDYNRLMLAFRWSLSLPVTFNMWDAFNRRMYIAMISDKIRYLQRMKKAHYIRVFELYVKNFALTEADIFNELGLNPQQGKRILNGFINNLVNIIVPKEGLNEADLKPFQPSKSKVRTIKHKQI